MIRAGTEERTTTRRRARKSGIRAGAASAEARMKARNRRRWLTFALGVGLVVECAAGALTSPMFYVRKVELSGTGALDSGEAARTLAAAEVPGESGIVRFDGGALKSRLERLPWVERAQIGRRLPGTLTAGVSLRKPFAILLAGGQQWQIDRTGTVIRLASGSDKLPLIESASSSEVRAGQRVIDDSFDDALGVSLSLERQAGPPIEKIVVDSQAHICLNMSDGIVVRLGRSEQMDVKLALVEKIYREQPDIATRVDTIDLTAPENPACRPLTESRKAERAAAQPNSAKRSEAVEGGSRSD